MKKLIPAILLVLLGVSVVAAYPVHISGVVTNRITGHKYSVAAYDQSGPITGSGGVVDKETGAYTITIEGPVYVLYLKAVNSDDPDSETPGIRNLGYTVSSDLTGKNIVMGYTISEM